MNSVHWLVTGSRQCHLSWLSRLLVAAMVLVQGGWDTAPAWAQEETGQQVSDLIPIDEITNRPYIAIRSINEFQQDVARLLRDLDQQGLFGIVKGVLEPYAEVFDADRPMFVWSPIGQDMLVGGWPAPNVRFRPVDPLIQFKKLRLPAEAQWLEGGNQKPGELIRYRGQLLLGRQPDPAWFSDQRWSQSLDERSLALIDRSGISLISRLDGDWLQVLQGLESDLSPAEAELMQTIRQKYQDGAMGLVGMKYHDQFLETRFRSQLPPQQNFEDVFQTPLPAPSNVNDLGLPRQGLLGSIMVRMDGSRQAAAAHLIPRLITGPAAENSQLQWLSGDALETLLRLMGDSWQDLHTARVALYTVPETAGRFSILGVVDARDSDQVLRELERISTLSDQAAPGEDLSDATRQELRRLLSLLKSESQDERLRAETRLKLAGPRVLPFLKQQDVKPPAQTAFQRVIAQLEEEQQKRQDVWKVTDPSFWSTLRPSMRFVKDTGTLLNHPCHQVQIQPDPTKPPQEVEAATQLITEILGPQWDRITVVQIDDHFLFQLGSDSELLKRSIRLTEAGQGDLLNHGAGEPLRAAAPIVQLQLDLAAVSKALQPEHVNFEFEEQPLTTLSLNMESSALDLQALVPVELIRFYFRFMSSQ